MGQGFSIKAKANAEADIEIYEDVGAFFGGITAVDFSQQLRALGSVSIIHVRIASEGGDVTEGLAMYRRLVEHPARVIVHIDSVANSIASIIAMAGDEIRISESGSIMIHRAWAKVAGNDETLIRFADRLKKTTNAMIDIYAARTKNSKADIEKWMRVETIFNAKQAVELGFADTIEPTALRMAAKNDPARYRLMNRSLDELLALPAQILPDQGDDISASIASPESVIETPKLDRPKYNALAARIALMKAQSDMRRLARA